MPINLLLVLKPIGKFLLHPVVLIVIFVLCLSWYVTTLKRDAEKAKATITVLAKQVHNGNVAIKAKNQEIERVEALNKDKQTIKTQVQERVVYLTKLEKVYETKQNEVGVTECKLSDDAVSLLNESYKAANDSIDPK